jgi:hypothetical protein
VVSALGANAAFTLIFPPLLKNPNTKMKISGNAILKITADGLLKIERRLALVIASIALI